MNLDETAPYHGCKIVHEDRCEDVIFMAWKVSYGVDLLITMSVIIVWVILKLPFLNLVYILSSRSMLWSYE